MPTENGEIGTLYIADNDGNYHEFGGIKEINIELDESVDVMEMDFSLTDEITIPITLSRKSKKIWGKILMMPKYVITEWCFPRKKKRGTMRRNRSKGGGNNEIDRCRCFNPDDEIRHDRSQQNQLTNTLKLLHGCHSRNHTKAVIQNDRFVAKYSTGYVINRVIYSHVGRKAVIQNDGQEESTNCK